MLSSFLEYYIYVLGERQSLEILILQDDFFALTLSFESHSNWIATKELFKGNWGNSLNSKGTFFAELFACLILSCSVVTVIACIEPHSCLVSVDQANPITL